MLRYAIGLVSLYAISLPAMAADEVALLSNHADIRSMCGTKPVTVAFVDGFGGSAWHKTTAQEVRDELSKCKNITKFTYLDANGDQQKYNSDLNGLVAQKTDVIVSFAHFGDSSIPAFRNAFKAGVTVVPYFSKLSGASGKDYTTQVLMDQRSVGLRWAEWVGKTLKTGNVVFMGGSPGAVSSQRFLAAFKEGIAKYPGIKLLEDNYIVTNWNPGDAQKAVAGLLAKYPTQINAVVTDYGSTALAAIKSFEQAGLAVPAIATIASINEINCKYLDAKKQGKAWKYITVDGTTTIARFAVRRALAIFEGTTNNEPLAVSPFPFADSEAGVDPKCDASLPPDADLSGQLPAASLKALFK